MSQQLISLPLTVLNTAHWNYKSNNKAMMASLTANMKQRGQIQLIIVRELGKEKYEIVNGNHRYEALLALGATEAVCLNLGAISLGQAKRIAFETNETEFAADTIKLADIVKELATIFTKEDLEATLPFSKKEIDEMAALTSFNFDDENEDHFFNEDQAEDEPFELDDATPQTVAAPIQDNSSFVLEYLMTEDVRDKFLSAWNMLKGKLASKKAKTDLNNDYEVGFLIKLINDHVEKKNLKKNPQTTHAD